MLPDNVSGGGLTPSNVGSRQASGAVVASMGALVSVASALVWAPAAFDPAPEPAPWLDASDSQSRQGAPEGWLGPLDAGSAEGETAADVALDATETGPAPLDGAVLEDAVLEDAVSFGAVVGAVLEGVVSSRTGGAGELSHAQTPVVSSPVPTIDSLERSDFTTATCMETTLGSRSPRRQLVHSSSIEYCSGHAHTTILAGLTARGTRPAFASCRHCSSASTVAARRLSVGGAGP